MIILQNTQTLQLFTVNIKQKLFTIVFKHANRNAWVERSKVLLNEEAERKSFK